MWDAENASVQSLFFFFFFKVLSHLVECVLQLFSIHHWTHLEMEKKTGLFSIGERRAVRCAGHNNLDDQLYTSIGVYFL